jgi:peroxiredoxin
LPPTPLTLDGSFILHQMFRVRWTAWRALGSEKKHVLTGAVATFSAMEENKQEPTGLFSLLGHKGDLMIVHFRKTLDEINHAELTVARTELNEYIEPTTSYLSVVELGLYEASVKLYAELTAQGLQHGTAEWNKAIETELANSAKRRRRACGRRFPSAAICAFTR